MRFRSFFVGTYCVLILFVLLILGQQGYTAQIWLSILYGLLIIIQLVLLLADDAFTVIHGYITGVAFLSLAYIVVNMMGVATITTFFLGALFITLYLMAIAAVLINDWHQYTMFDRMIDNMNGKEKPSPIVPVEQIVEEPPHVRLRHNDEGEWIEIKVKPAKTAKTVKKKSAKKARKKAAKKNSQGVKK